MSISNPPPSSEWTLARRHSGRERDRAEDHMSLADKAVHQSLDDEARAVLAALSAPTLSTALPVPAEVGNGSHSERDDETDDAGRLTAMQARARRSARIEAGATICVDLTALVGAMLVGLIALATVSGAEANSVSRLWQNLGFDLPFLLVTLILFAVYGLYRRRRRRLRPRGFHDVGPFFHAVAAGALLTLGVSVVIHRLTGHSEIASAQLFAIALATLVLVPVGRAASHSLLRNRPNLRTRVLIVGSGVVAEQVRRHCAVDPGVEVVGLLDDDPAPGSKVIGPITELSHVCDDLAVDRVLVTFSRSHPSGTIHELRNLYGTVPISVVPRYFELMSYRSQVDEIDGLPMIDVAPRLLGPGSRFIKRSLDVVGSALGFLVLAPVLVGAGLAIKLSSRGPMFFGQTRVGRDGQTFTIWKLRTMRLGAEAEHSALAAHLPTKRRLLKLEKDPRVFRVGSFLRRTSIDEIPQLLNVLRGEMSLVGPRPFIPEESGSFDGWASRRYEMRPGLTGLWQVSGRSDLSFDQLQQLDYLYVASWSILWDLRILWRTPAVVLRGRGAY
jgi:exopolysaccharide biosynthesis polyprenyl glycosylphosphotransferase